MDTNTDFIRQLRRNKGDDKLWNKMTLIKPFVNVRSCINIRNILESLYLPSPSSQAHTGVKALEVRLVLWSPRSFGDTSPSRTILISFRSKPPPTTLSPPCLPSCLSDPPLVFLRSTRKEGAKARSCGSCDHVTQAILEGNG